MTRRVLLVSHYYPPEVGAPQARLSEMARVWARDGARVTVLTGMPNHPTGRVPPSHRGALCRDEQRDGTRVLRTWLYATPNEGVVKKTLGHLSFMVTAVVLGGWRTGPLDVVVVSSPTFFSIGAAWLLARVRRARLVVEVRDLWPAIFVELGVLKHPSLIRLLERLELAAYASADAVVVVSEGFRENLISRGVPSDKVVTIRNGVDLTRFGEPRHPDPRIRRELGAEEDDVLVLYVGAHGISQGLTVVADAVALLGDERRIRVAFVGEGAHKELLRRRVEQLGLDRVVMLPAVPSEQVPDLLAAADVCLVPLRDVPLFSTFIPSKMFELLAARKAVIGSVTGEAARILTEAGALVVPPEDAAALADALRLLAGDQQRRRLMGERGRMHVEQNFDRVELARRYAALLQHVCDR